MSTYYYLACDTHRTCVPFWSRYAGGPSVIPTAQETPETVQDFLNAHLPCGMTVFSEHDDRATDYHDVVTAAERTE